jgi:hypothetical protein
MENRDIPLKQNKITQKKEKNIFTNEIRQYNVKK